MLFSFFAQITQRIVHHYKCTSLYFGEYGYPPRCNAWLGQCALYFIVMLIEKVNFDIALHMPSKQVCDAL